MADSNDTIVNIKTVADNSGAESARKELDEVGDSARRAADASDNPTKAAAGAWGAFGGAVRSATRVLRTFMGALGLIGFAVSAIQTVIGLFQKLKDWLDRDRKAAEELARQIQDARNKAAVEESAAAYEKLNAKVAETLRLEKERDRLADQKLGQERAAEDAQTELEMQKELAGLDRDDPDYAENAALVRSKYARIRSKRAAERATADTLTKQGRLIAASEEKESQASEYEKDVYGKSGDAVISVRKQIAEEKDPERRKNLERQLDTLLAQQQKKLAEIKRLRDEAESLRKEATSLIGADQAARISDKAVNVAQDAADADTGRRIAARREDERRRADETAAKEAEKAAQVAADRKTASEGRASIAALEGDAANEQSRAQAAADRYKAEQGDVVAAQNRYDMLVANGGSKMEKSAALAALQKEKDEALEAEREMEKVAAEVANTLQGINAQIRALASAVNKAQSRLAQNQTDAPEG